MMNKIMIISVIGGALIVLLTALFAFTPNSASPSSIPALKSYALQVINNQRLKFHLRPLLEGAAISADRQAKFLLTQLTLTHLDSAGNGPSKRYLENHETGYVSENISIYRCGDFYACETAISNAVDDMMNDAVSKKNILNPVLTHVSTGITVGGGKISMVFDFEAKDR